MTPNFTHKLLNAEIQPPDSAWEHIAAELDKLDGSGFVHKVAEASIEPPPMVWQNVASALNSPRAKTIPLNSPWVKWAAAAAIIGVIVVVAINYLNSGDRNSLVSAGKGEPKNETNVSPSTSNNSNESSPGTSASVNPDTRLADNIRPLTKRIEPRTTRNQTQVPVRHATIESAGIEKQELLGSDGEPRLNNNIPSNSATFIPAPDYFVVTAPNGEKVRISSKFSDAVASLYGGDNIDYYWKWRFDSWKSKLITNPSFIPSAGNFLDIAELKDMLKEQ